MQAKRIMGGLVTASMVLSLAAPFVASAAAPDGAAGAWADQVVSSSQGLAKDGSAVPAIRSDASQALGVAETTGTAVDAGLVNGTFFSLGFGGSVVLHFDNGVMNGPGDDVQVFEATNANYPDEKIMIEASLDGSSWSPVASSIARDGSADLGPLTCAQFIKLTDVSDINLFEQTADAYDLDAVKALHSDPNGCMPPVGIDCHTFEWDDATYYKLNPNKRPGGTVNIPNNTPANVNGHSSHVNIALANAIKVGATEQQKMLGWYLSLQMSMYNNGGAGSGPVLGILNSPMTCWSTWTDGAVVTLTNGVSIDDNTKFGDFVAQVKLALQENRTADYAALIALQLQLSQAPY